MRNSSNYEETKNLYPSDASGRGRRNNENQFMINDNGEAEYPETNLKEEISSDVHGYEDELFSAIDN